MKIFAESDGLFKIIFLIAVVVGPMIVEFIKRIAKEKEHERESEASHGEDTPKDNSERNGGSLYPVFEEAPEEAAPARPYYSPKELYSQGEFFDYEAEMRRSLERANETEEKLRQIAEASARKNAALAAKAPEPTRFAGAEAAPSMRRQLEEFVGDPKSMQKAFVISEILDRPVSMRPPKTIF